MLQPQVSRRTVVGFAAGLAFSLALWSALILALWSLRG
jgi:hypothetical protein